MKAILALADGRIFEGKSFGAGGESTGEVVFNTAMSGYQEVLTDPSYKGQMVTMTYPQIGNTGINPEDIESRGLFLSGFIVKEYQDCYSNWRATMSLDAYLKEHGVVGIQGIDTRALTRHLRDKGAQNGIISTTDLDPVSLVAKAKAVPSMAGLDLASGVSCDRPYHWTEAGWDLEEGYRQVDPAHLKYKVVAYDFGIKYNILRCLVDAGCDVTVVPASFPAAEVLAMKPDGVFLSNGPGDPAAVVGAQQTVAALREVARSRGIFVLAGSIAEKVDVPGKTANTSVLIADDGRIIHANEAFGRFVAQDIEAILERVLKERGETFDPNAAPIEKEGHTLPAPQGERTLSETSRDRTGDRRLFP